MSDFKQHPKGLIGSIADLEMRISREDAAVAAMSAKLARDLRAGGSPAILKYLSKPTSQRYLLEKDEHALRMFLISQQPEDTLATDDVTRIREKIVRLETILAAAIPNNVAGIAGFAPAIFLTAAWSFGLWSPIATSASVVCEFFMDSKFQSALGLKSSGKTEIWFYTANKFGFAALHGLFWIVAILAAARIWQRPHFIRTIVLHIALVACVYAYAGFKIINLKNIESKIPAYCSSHTINGAIQMPTAEQYKRFTPR